MAADLTLRKMSVEDIPAGLRLCRASGWNQVAEDWQAFLTWPGSGGFLAESEDRIVGTVALVRHEPLVWIAMMLVDPDHWREGVGTRLMEIVLDAAGGAECIGLDATPAGEPLYCRFGFVNDRRLIRMKASIAAVPELSAIVRRMNRADLSAILQRDREVFGADRGALLKWLFDRSPECAWIAEEGQTPRGYAFGRPGYLYHQIGPVVAEDAETARALVAGCCSRLSGRKVVIDTARFSAGWMHSLASLGFVEERPFVRMFRQPGTHPGLTGLQYAITGPEFA